MNSRKLRLYIELVRPVNMAIVFATILLAGILAKPVDWDWLWIVVASFSGALIAAGGNALNDFYDVSIDKINRPGRPLPSGALTPGEAWRIWIITASTGAVLCLFLSFWNVLIALAWVGGLYAYSRYWKGSVLIGNVAVAAMTGLAFPFGAIVGGRASTGVYPGIFAFLVNIARELLKDVEDVNGDAQAGLETLPIKYGPEAGLIGASAAIGLLIIMTIVPVIFGVYNFTYLLFVLLVDLGLAYVALSMWYDSTLSNLKKLSLILKGCMVGGLFAIFLGS